MSALTDIDVTATPLLVEHRPWWRSRVTLTGAIVGVMLVAYFGWKSQYPWPASLTWNEQEQVIRYPPLFNVFNARRLSSL